MQNLLTAAQLREADVYTIKHLPITSINLMENAAKAFVKLFVKTYPVLEKEIAVICGQGNNGGDGLAIARLLFKQGYQNIKVYLIQFSAKESEDYNKNLERLKKEPIPILTISKNEELKDLSAELMIDAVLGSGLNKPLTAPFIGLCNWINGLKKEVVSVDVPTGFKCEGELSTSYDGIKASLTICFQRPKLNFFFPESVVAFEQFKVVNIGLIEADIESRESDWKLITKSTIKQYLKPRANFTHKGTYGHALIVGGNENTMGAALLAASACLHAGAGLTTVCLPACGLIALNTSLPEVMALPRTAKLDLNSFDQFTAIGIGPGLGTEIANETLLAKLIALKKPLVIDADGLTLLARRKDLLAALPAQSILTPHMKEFDRLFGTHENWWQRVQTAKREAQIRNLVIVLKNQYTFVCLPNGEVRINPTGNPAMASGGMGDVLTGLILSLKAQGYPTETAATLAVYLHGKAGDELAKKRFVVNASKLAIRLPKTIKKILA